jgi:hypothetical protein
MPRGIPYAANAHMQPKPADKLRQYTADKLRQYTAIMTQSDAARHLNVPLYQLRQICRALGVLNTEWIKQKGQWKNTLSKITSQDLEQVWSAVQMQRAAAS